MKHAHFNKRQDWKPRARELILRGYTARKLSATLNNEGFRTARGNAFTRDVISSWCRHNESFATIRATTPVSPFLPVGNVILPCVSCCGPINGAKNII